MTDPRTQDALWMTRAVALAAQGGLAVRPNPQVGCVLVRDGVVVGEGYHARCGGPHAEAAALQNAGAAARGATAYVTLEPCNHHGRTPPCAAALIAAGVRRVVIGVADPNPTAAGGSAYLRAAGVVVDIGVEAEACERVAALFLHGQRTNRAFLRLKLAATLDGYTAATDGTSQWITGRAARVEVHRLRAEADVVLVGSGTAIADNPRLDVRHVPWQQQPLRVVLDRRLRLPIQSHLTDVTHSATRVIIADQSLLASDAARRLRDRGVEICCVEPAAPGGEEQLPWLTLVLRSLLSSGAHHVLCEGGATLAAALLRADLVDRLDVFQAPKLLGRGRPLWPDLGITTLANAAQWRFDAPRSVGEDVWLTATPHRPTLHGRITAK